ncbi:putative homeodomain transcription factor 2 [Actinia tenebrosa]|uniref:Homeodomain transcription factor 2 n=1 Tax=Actinia tenebrosa TaxID=6105 RepID=A0A6P8IFZ0_ACTTE|nr:putative homeodomain transcription factor 2 [Actinia tenebrosa]
MDLDRNLSWFHRKLGRYDKALWERTFEEQEQEQSSVIITKKPGNLRPELIDVDLVVGSTFHKAKPVHTWLAVAKKGLLRVIFYPYYHSWWRQQTSPKIWLLFLFLYFFEILALVIYFFSSSDSIKIVSWTEVYGPALIMVLLGTLHFHMVSTDHAENIRRSRKTKQIKKRRVSRPKRMSDKSGSPQANGKDVSNGLPVYEHKSEEVPNNIRKRKVAPKGSEEAQGTTQPPNDGIKFCDFGSVESKEQEHSEDDASESSDSTAASTSDSDVSDTVEMESINEEDPFACVKKIDQIGDETTPNLPTAEIVMVSVWEGEQCKKAHMTLMEISAAIVNKVDMHKGNNGYIHFSCFVSILLGIVPLLFRIYEMKAFSSYTSEELFSALFGYTIWSRIVVVVGILERIVLCFSFLFLLCVAERSYRERCLYAKLFGWLTSSRKARRAGLPHFRLHKVRNIKTWLSLRALLKRRGPQRSVDMIVSSSFLLGIALVIVMCAQLLKGTEKERFPSLMFNWEVSVWGLVLSIYVLRFMTLGSKINHKYRNTSVVLTEQINLYLQMERSPHKKDELMIAHHVLKLAAKLLKEIESPFKLSGLSMNPLLYNITRVVVLSLFSGVMSDLLGFRLKVWKIRA